MLAWIAANWLTILCIAAVLGLAAACIRNLIPRRGKTSACAGCAFCSSCSGSCAVCQGKKQ